MKNAEAIRKDAYSMSKEVKRMILKFQEKHGDCELNINIGY